MSDFVKVSDIMIRPTRPSLREIKKKCPILNTHHCRLIRLVMCSLERTKVSDPIPAVVIPIPTPVKWEPLVTSELSGVVWSHPESSGVVRNRSWSESTGAVRSNMLVIRHFISLGSFSLRVHFVYRSLFRRPTPDNSG